MKINLNNVAKVKNAEIEISGITVIAGYNGTGKSTVCKALYSICTAFSQLNQKVIRSRQKSIYNAIRDWDNGRHLDNKTLYISDLGDTFLNAVEQKEISLENLTRDQLNDIFKDIGVTANTDEFDKLLNISVRVTQRSHEEYARFLIERAFIYCFGGQLNTLDKDNVADISLEEDGKVLAKVSIRNNRLFDSTMAQIPMDAPVYIETSSYLDILGMQRNRRINIPKIPLSALYKSEEDITLEQYKELGEIKEICTQIINEVTHGELVASSTNREIIYQEEDIKEGILCCNIASGLKNILIIQRMLENGFLNSHTILLIDEPEVNLHPEWQVKFAEILVMLCKKLDIKIVLNTHSPYFMRAIETKMADNEIADKGKYYFMKQIDALEYIAEEVTGKTEVVYQTMYKPLEDL